MTFAHRNDDMSEGICAAINSLLHSVIWLSHRTNIKRCGLSEVVHIVSLWSTGSSADCERRTYDSHTG